MATSINRRQWLKNSTLATGSLAFLGGNLSNLLAAPASVVRTGATTLTLSEEEQLLLAPPDLKARLSANENPFGPSPKAKQAIRDAIDKSYQYPFAYTQQLVDKIAAHEGLTKDHITLGPGSSPLLQAAAIHFGQKGGNIISGDPSYVNLPGDASEYFKSKWIKVPLTEDYKLDLDAMEKAVNSETVLVYICNPNNPTGTVLDTEKLKGFCERVSRKVPVFIDEAYIDYVDDTDATTMIDCVRKGHNVIVARTFSKLYGFAGLRVGYIVAQPEMQEILFPYTKGGRALAAPSINAAVVAYKDSAFMQEALNKTKASKEFLYSVLKEENYAYIPSVTNFVMFPINIDGQRFSDEMMKRGVSVRFWKFNNQDWCRVSIGLMDEMKYFKEAFRQIS